jgi:hypothetical protein
MLPQELQNAIEKFGQEVRRLYTDFSETFPNETSGTAYHYTTEAGLYGILKSGMLWLTDIFALNDPSELRHGICLALKAFDTTRINDLPEREWYREAVSKVLSDGLLPKVVQPYTCSFSNNDDDLGQWRGYADDGKGYSIGFDMELLDKEFSHRGTYVRPATFSVAYNDQRLIEIFKKEAKLIKPIASIHSSHHAFVYCNAIVQEFLRWAVLFSLYFKHPASVTKQNTDSWNYMRRLLLRPGIVILMRRT